VAVESTASTFLAWVRADLGDGRTEQGWVTRYEQAHPEIFEVYYRGWGDPRRRAAAVRHAGTTANRIARVEARARELTVETARRLGDAKLLPDAELSAVLLVGVGTANGWVATMGDEPTLFLALEMFPDPPFDHVLVLHEAVHLAHQLARPRPWPETVATRTFEEGLATVVSRRLLPGHDPVGYLWFEAGRRSWLASCQRQWHAIRSQLTDALDLGEEHHGDPFFSARPGSSGDLPLRSGYYAGMKAGDWLVDQQGIPVSDLLGADATTATDYVRTFLAEAS